MSSPSGVPDASARCVSVRFEDACVLIPPCAVPKSPLRPRIVTKSYSLPLWKPSPPRKVVTNFQSLVSEVSEASSPETERKAFSLTVSVPSLTTKSRRRAPSLPPPSPCLSRRSYPPHSPNSTTPPSSPLSSPTTTTPAASSSTLHRAPAFPQIQPAAFTHAETVPLRPCCEACHPCVDAALAEGESWSEPWSRGAVRRYSEGEHVHLHAPLTSAFGVTWTPASVCDNANMDMPLEDALTIDEVDVKRRSGDYSHALLNNHHVPLPATADLESEEEEISQELTAEITTVDTAVDTLLPGALVSTVQEEDEDLLFPLPSPRRTPNQSPAQTPSGSQVNLAPSPPGSQTHLGPSGSQINVSAPAVSSPLAGQNVIPSATQSSPPSLASPHSPVSPPDPAPPGSMSSSPVYRRQRSLSPADTRRSTRRPSLSTASETLIKGSVSVLKGVAATLSGTVGAM